MLDSDGKRGARLRHRRAGADDAHRQIVEVLLAGGAGYGDPRQRAREAVRRDMRLGLVTAEAARRDYGLEEPRRCNPPRGDAGGAGLTAGADSTCG